MIKFSIYIYIINITMNIKLIDLKTIPNIEHVLGMNNIYLYFVLTKYFFNTVYV